MGYSKSKARARAFELYCEGEQQKRIAVLVGVAEKTICQWKESDQWEVLRGPATLLGKVPAWGMRVLHLLAEQQDLLQQLRAEVADLKALLPVPPPPA